MLANKKHTKCLMILLSWMILILIGCSNSEEDNQDTSSSPISSSTLSTFKDNAELEHYLKEQFAKSIVDITYSGNGGASQPSPDDSGPASEEGQDSDTGDYTPTNVQEQGVDEADVVKTDGAYFYIAGTDKVSIVNTKPPLQKISEVTVSGYVDSLYIYKDLLVVIYTPVNGSGKIWPQADPADELMLGIPYWIPVEAEVGISVYDLNDIDNPAFLFNTEVDGYLVSSRLVGNRLHVVHQFLPNLPPIQVYYDSSFDDTEAVIAANMEQMEDVALSDLIPYFITTDSNGTTSQASQAVMPDDFYYPEDQECGGSITTIMTFDLDRPMEIFKSASVVADANIVYASTDALYIASSQWNGWSSSTAVSPSQRTVVHKFDITGDEVVSSGGGIIAGWVLNQFSLGEKDGVLRIATTVDTYTDGTSKRTNNVYCLEAKDGKLNVIGSLEDLAQGEKLYAARFIGDRGYLVTFVTIDPLFTLDMSDPTTPKVVGELKIPGYSDYIHPFGEDHLITIGKDTLNDDWGAWYQGVQLCIFDISDFANPKLLHKKIIGDRGTGSEALLDHKAFTFWSSNNLLAVPVDLYINDPSPREPWDYGTYKGSGLFVYRVSTEHGFESIGQIDTMDNPAVDYPPNPWTRGIFMDADIFAITPTTVRWAEVDDIENTVHSFSLSLHPPLLFIPYLSAQQFAHL
jgi:uncharacterized secreted protein with C-terminal beta-propeller domain